MLFHSKLWVAFALTACVHLADACFPPPAPAAPPAPVVAQPVARPGPQPNPGAIPPSSNLPDVDIQALTSSIRALGGSATFDGIIPFGAAESGVSLDSELRCSDFGPECAWRNELGFPGSPGRDELEWTRARGQLDGGRMGLIFGTTVQPNGKWALCGSGDKIPQDHAALLVSAPLACTPGDGELQFRYWTTPRTQIRVCTRSPGDGKNYDQCSPPLSKGDPGPAIVLVPGPKDKPFEIVIEARRFDFSFAGQSGGAVIIDDISYSGPICPFTGSLPSGLCYDPRLTPDQLSSFLPASTPIGNFHTGIRAIFEGGYAVVKGPSPETLLRSPPFVLQRPKVLQFCFYRATVRSDLRVLSVGGGRVTELYSSGPLGARPHVWTCERRLLDAGAYDSLDFVAENLRNKHSFLALDEINIVAENGPYC